MPTHQPTKDEEKLLTKLAEVHKRATQETHDGPAREELEKLISSYTGKLRLKRRFPLTALKPTPKPKAASPAAKVRNLPAIEVSEDLHCQLRVRAATDEVTLEDCVLLAVQAYVGWAS